jgi:hypothetical protein
MCTWPVHKKLVIRNSGRGGLGTLCLILSNVSRRINYSTVALVNDPLCLLSAGEGSQGKFHTRLSDADSCM